MLFLPLWVLLILGLIKFNKSITLRNSLVQPTQNKDISNEIVNTDYPVAERSKISPPQPNPTLSADGLVPCKASNLEGEFFGEPVMGGAMTAGIRIYNTGAVSCTLQGFPDLDLLDANSRKITLSVTKTNLSDFLGGKMGEKVVLLPKSSLGDGRYPWGVAVLSMNYYYRNAADDTKCPKLGYKKLVFKITLPDDQGVLLVYKPDESQPFINTICGDIEYGTFEQI